MAGSTDSFLSLAKGLEENLGKAVKQLQSFNDVSQNVNTSFAQNNKQLSATNDTAKKVNVVYDDIGKSAEAIATQTRRNESATAKWGEAVDKVKSYAKTMFNVFVGGMSLLSFATAIEGAVSLHQNMRDLSFQMGYGAKGAKTLEDGIMNITAATGFALDDVETMVSTLTKMKVPLANMNQLATDSLRFSQITGASNSQIANMTGGLVKMGGMGAKSISNMMASIVQTQRAFGMTGEAVGTLTDSIVDTTSKLKNMGKSSGEIEKFQKGTVKLAGAFASVGIEASTATGLIERMLDPGKLEDNALLFAKLGISIEDAMGGNLDPGQLVSGLQGLGKELQNMSGPQASQLARSLEIPLNQLRQMGNMDTAGLEKMAKDMGLITNSSGALAGAQDDQATAQRDMAQVWDKIKGTIGNIVIKLMPVFDTIAKIINQNMSKILAWVNKLVNSGMIERFIGGIVKAITFVAGFIPKVVDGIAGFFKTLDPKKLLIGIVLGIAAVIGGILLFKRQFASVSTDSAKVMVTSFKNASTEIGQEISYGISSGLEMASRKSSIILKSEMKKSSRVVGDDLETRIVEGSEHAAFLAAAEYQKVLGNQNTFGWTKGLNKATAEWLEKISMGAKPLSLLESYYKKVQDRIKEKMNLSQVDYQAESANISVRLDGETAYGIKLTERKAFLQGIATDEKGTLDVGKLSEEQKKELVKINKELTKNELEKTKSANEILTLAEKETTAKANYLKQLAPKELLIYEDNLKNKKAQLEATRNQELVTKANLETENNILKSIDFNLKMRKNDIELKINSGNATLDEMKAYKEINASLSENDELLKSNNATIKKIDEGASDYNKSLENINDELKQAGDLTGKLDKDLGKELGSAPIFTSFGQKLKNAAKGAVGLIGTGVTDFGQKLGKSLHATGKAVATFLNPKNLKAAIVELGDGSLLKGAAKLLGGAISGAVKLGARALGMGGLVGAVGGLISGKKKDKFDKAGNKIEKKPSKVGKAAKAIGGFAAGGLGLLMGAMAGTEKGKEVMEKVQGALADIMGKLMAAITPLIDNLLPTIMGLIDSLLPVIMMLVNALLPPMLRVLAFLLNIIGSLISALGGVMQALGMKELGKSVSAIGDGMKSAASGMVKSADIMSGAAMKMGEFVDKNARATLEQTARMKDLNTSTKEMTNTLGITTEEASKMTVEDITEKMKGTKGTKTLTDQMELNNKELAKQYTLIAARNLAETTALAMATAVEENKKEVINALSKTENLVFTAKSQDNDLLIELRNKNKVGEFTAAVKAAGGINQNIINQFSEVFKKSYGENVKAEKLDEGTQRDWLGYAEKLDIRASKAGMNNTALGEMQKTLVESLVAGSAEKTAAEKLTIGEFSKISSASQNDPEKMKAMFTALFSTKGGALDEAGIKKVLGERIETTLAGAKGLNNFDKIKEDLLAIQKNKNDSEQQKLTNFETYLKANAEVVAAQIKGMSAKQIAETAKSKETATTTAPVEVPKGSSETKLYPAMISAVEGSTAFMKTQDARIITTGMTPEEETKNNTARIAMLIEQMVNLGGKQLSVTEYANTIAAYQSKKTTEEATAKRLL